MHLQRHKVELPKTSAKPLRKRNRFARAWRRHVLLTQRKLQPARPPDTSLPSDPASSIRYFANPGPEFELRNTPEYPPENTLARAVAFYLPQFHAFPENDAWWGKGFTEWRNVSRGTPRYQGHYQPRIPRDLGFYDLRNVEVLKAQSALARAAGINAFCFYYYWFNGKRLMEKPLNLFAESDIDQEFCIMWANENWTRRWDGRDNDILIAQHYESADEADFLADTAAYMAHPRYLKVNNRPLFILYRPALIPDARNTIARWRQQWLRLLDVEPLIFIVQSYTEYDPQPYGCDGAIEFPPHKVSRNIKRQNRHYRIFDPEYAGQIRAYEDVVAKSLSEPAPCYPLIKTVSPSWDNDARREGCGVTFQGSTPAAYGNWLSGAIDFARKNPVGQKPLVFINAWNEWAEAAYLEPDVHYGHAYLNATYRALVDNSRAVKEPQLLLVGHDAHANGAQMLLLSLARYFVGHEKLDIRILLKNGGKLLPEYQSIAPTTVLSSFNTDSLRHWFSSCGCQHAIFNTCVTGDLLNAAKQANMQCLSLVHELPSLIRDFGLQTHVNDIAHLANHIVFPSNRVKTGFNSFEPEILSSVTIQPQGLYKPINMTTGMRMACRNTLGLGSHDRLVINVGYADHRKGFDLFAQAALRLCKQHVDIHFCWVGKRNKLMTRWLRSNVGRTLNNRLHLIDFTADIAPWYSAADCLYLSSREDPFPSVVLEAMSLGMPVVVHDEATGFDNNLLELIYHAPEKKPAYIDQQLISALSNDCEQFRMKRKRLIQEHFQIEDYAGTLLQLLDYQILREDKTEAYGLTGAAG